MPGGFYDDADAKEAPEPGQGAKMEQQNSPEQSEAKTVSLLQQSMENLERALNALSDEVWVISADHVIEFLNETARGLFGDVRGKKCYEALKGSERPCSDCPVEEIISKAKSVYRTTHRQEDRVWEITATPLVNAEGKTSVLEIVRDVTAATELQAKLRRSERLASVGQAAAGLAHEIKNPLSAITTFAQLLPEKYDDEEFREVFTRTAVQAARKITRLLEELASYARPIKPVLEETDIREVVEEAILEVHPKIGEKAARVTRDLPREPLLASIDREQIRQVIVALLTNSVDAVGEGGNITVSARFVPGVPEGAPGTLEVTVSDDGCGIAAEDLERVFEPLFTTSEHKLGLGLAIARKIVEEHGGTIEAESRPGAGATFVVTLRRS